MIKYNVRSRQLIDIVNDLKEGKLIRSPFFQRKLVWRDIHKVDFIQTILYEFPFPEIFIAKGDLDIEKMTSTSCIVDGQQRLSAIQDYIEGKFKVDEKLYSDLEASIKEKFLKYEIAIIDLDLRHDDPQISEMFKRLNRTFYSLSNIEKISSEFSASEFMLVAKLLCGEIFELNSVEDDLDYPVQMFNPNITPEFNTWAKNKKINFIQSLFLELEIFNSQEVSRQVHLNQMINILATIDGGIFNRNADKQIFTTYAYEYPNKDEIVDKLNDAAKLLLSIKFKKKSYWLNKANIFSLLIFFYNNLDKLQLIEIKTIKAKLDEFEIQLPEEYRLAAKEGVNNKKERIIRNKHLEELFLGSNSSNNE